MKRKFGILSSLAALLVLFTQPAHAAPYTFQKTFTTVSTYAAVPDQNGRQVGTGFNKHQIICWIEGTADAATVKLQKSVDNVTFTDAISLDCTTGGASSITSSVGNYFRIGLTAATNLSTGAKITIFYAGFPEALQSGSSGGGGSIDCESSDGILYGSSGECNTSATLDGSGNLVAASLKASGLTSGRIPYASTGGLLADISGFTFAGGTITTPTGVTTKTLILSGSSSGQVTIAPAAAAGTFTLTLPATSGGANQVLTTNGSAGVLSWTTPSAGGGCGVGADCVVNTLSAVGFSSSSGIFANAASGFTGNLSQLQVDGSNKFRVSESGAVTAAGYYVLGTLGAIRMETATDLAIMTAAADAFQNIQATAHKAAGVSSIGYALTNTDRPNDTIDTNLSRGGASGIVAVGTGAAGSSAGGIKVTTVIGSGGAVAFSFVTPTCSGGGCALAVGSVNNGGKLTTTTTGAASITVTFSTAFTHAPACVANNETTANLIRATSSTTAVVIAGTTVSGDTLSWNCLGL